MRFFSSSKRNCKLVAIFSTQIRPPASSFWSQLTMDMAEVPMGEGWLDFRIVAEQVEPDVGSRIHSGTTRPTPGSRSSGSLSSAAPTSIRCRRPSSWTRSRAWSRWSGTWPISWTGWSWCRPRCSSGLAWWCWWCCCYCWCSKPFWFSVKKVFCSEIQELWIFPQKFWERFKFDETSSSSLCSSTSSRAASRTWTEPTDDRFPLLVVTGSGPARLPRLHARPHPPDCPPFQPILCLCSETSICCCCCCYTWSPLGRSDLKRGHVFRNWSIVCNENENNNDDNKKDFFHFSVCSISFRMDLFSLSLSSLSIDIPRHKFQEMWLQLLGINNLWLHWLSIIVPSNVNVYKLW